MEQNQIINELNKKVFNQLERLDNPNLTGKDLQSEIERAKAIALCANQVIVGMNTVIKAEMLKRQVPALEYRDEE